MSEDGRSLANDDVIKDNNRILKLFSSQSNQYEVGLVLEYTDFKAPTDEDVKKYKTIQDAIYELNKDGIDKIRQTAFETLREYFKFFSDTPENSISKEKMVEFIPDYNGEKISVEDYKIKSMDEKKVQDYLMNRKNSKTEDSKNFKPRFGFKYGYTLVFGTSSEGNKSTENVKDAQKEQKWGIMSKESVELVNAIREGKKEEAKKSLIKLFKNKIVNKIKNHRES